MKKQDPGAIPIGTVPSQTTVRQETNRPLRWLAGIVAMTMTTLLVGLGVVACTSAGQHSGNRGAPIPAAGSWVPTLKGYALSSLIAVRNDPPILYACATKTQLPGQSSPATAPTIYTVLRSADFGTHWQDIGASLALKGLCDVAVNPADGNDIFVVGGPTSSAGASALLHSTDGGQTWSTINPVYHIPGLNSAPAWSPRELSMEGSQLFAVQRMLPATFSLPGQATSPAATLNRSLQRLVTSADGGFNWTALDSRFNNSWQEAWSYAVDPTNTDTIYEVVTRPLSPVLRPVPRQGVDGLYKTTDSGSNWQLLQQGLPYTFQVQLATNNSSMVYLGGMTGGPQPLALTAPGATKAAFTLSISSDGGTTWRPVPLPSSITNVQRWFVAADGHVFADTGEYIAPPTVTGGTGSVIYRGTRPPGSGVAPGHGSPVPQNTPPPGNPVIEAPSPTPTDIPVSTAVSVPGTPVALTPPQPGTIQVYDPASGSWSQLTTTPSSGVLLAVTPANANGGGVLWYMGTLTGSNALGILYRNVA